MKLPIALAMFLMVICVHPATAVLPSGPFTCKDSELCFELEKNGDSKKCFINVPSEKMKWPYWDEWSMKDIYSRYWKITRRSGNKSCYNGCWCGNDKYENIIIKKAKKGSVIYLFDDNCNNPLLSRGDKVRIEILKDFNSAVWDSGSKYAKGLVINGFEYDQTDKYYKKTFFRQDGSLDRRVSCVLVSVENAQNNSN